jgi:PRTRC genetic system protein B
LPPTAYDAVPRVRVTLTDEAAYLARFDQRGHLSGEYPIDLAQVAQAFNVFGASTGLLDERTLFWQTRNGQTRLGVWLPPQRRTLAYTAGRGEERLTLPLPGFVFVGQGTRYGIWAAAKRPRGSFDHLCHAPLPNVHTTGLICAGNVRFPVCDIGTIHRAAELFFESDFNADLSADKVTYHGPLYKFWKSIQRAKHFPSEKLIHHTTIATLMNADF